MPARHDAPISVNKFNNRSVVYILLACFVLLGAALLERRPVVPPVPAAHAGQSPAASATARLASLPVAAQSGVSAAFGRDLPAYQVRAQREGFRLT